MARLTELADKKNLKLTTSRIGIIRKVFTTTNENAEPVLDKDGNPEPDKSLKETEQVPMLYDGGIIAFFENEIHPYVPDAWVDEKDAVIGYEMSFTKYFNNIEQLRSVEEIVNDIRAIEQSTDGLLTSIIGGVLHC